MQVIPAILSNDVGEIYGQLKEIRDAGKYERVQIDFIDGEYANNLTVRPAEVDLLAFLPLTFDAHLMVTENNVLVWSKTAEKIGYDRIAVQMESVSDPENYAGLAVDIHSPVEAVKPFLNRAELVILMAVEPGFSSQEFDDRVVDKVRELCGMRKAGNYGFRICVDGGVQKEHLQVLSDAGADEVAVGVKRVLDW